MNTTPTEVKENEEKEKMMLVIRDEFLLHMKEAARELLNAYLYGDDMNERFAAYFGEDLHGLWRKSPEKVREVFTERSFGL
jgi:hypothetical protein